jgi:hypothetical protein
MLMIARQVKYDVGETDKSSLPTLATLNQSVLD